MSWVRPPSPAPYVYLGIIVEKETEGFSIAVEDVGPCKKRVAIVVPGEKIKGALEKRLQEVGSTANVPGFRKGRVPRSVLERHFRSKKRVAIVVPGEKIKGALEKRLQEVGSTANVPGFRKGRVPRSVLERHF